MSRSITVEEIAVWKAGWAAARRIHTNYVPCFYCDPPQGFDRLHGHVKATHDKTLGDFRTDFGLNQNSRLVSVRFSEAMAAKRGKALAKTGRATRFTKGKKGRAASLIAVTARKNRATSIEARRNISAAHRGRTQPKLRKADRLGRTIPSWDVVEPRLRGLETKAIAEMVSKKYEINLTPGAIVGQLRTIGLPQGRPARFDRGWPVTEQRLISHWEDFQFVRGGKIMLASAREAQGKSEQEIGVIEAAALLEVSESWIYERCRARSGSQIPHRKNGKQLSFRPAELLDWAARMQHGKSKLRPRDGALRELANRLNIGIHRLREIVIQQGGPNSRRRRGEKRKFDYPLSLKLASRLVEVAEPRLKGELKNIGATVKGGNPEALLPSEKQSIPREYEELMSGCDAALEWSRKQEAVDMESLGEWMCSQQGAPGIKAILFWPKLHVQVLEMCQEKAGDRKLSAPLFERVKEWLAKDHGCSTRTLERILAEGRKAMAATA